MAKAFHNLVEAFSQLPGIGERSASRIAFYLLKADASLGADIAQSITSLKEEIAFCEICGSLTERTICEICTDTSRDAKLLCVVEEPGDVFVIEKTGEFFGRYHVLMGAISPLDGIGPEDLRIEALDLKLRQEEQLSEILIATNPTLEGDATADYINKLFQKYSRLKITRISHGIPTGSAIEFSEPSVLARSIRSRISL